jgi:L-threonylcarbamoyladenylate synthase
MSFPPATLPHDGLTRRSWIVPQARSASEMVLSGKRPAMSLVVRLPESPSDRDIVLGRAAEILRQGGLVAFPTETVYGLGANALDTSAVARIFTAKGRPANNPLIVHVAEIADVLRVASGWPELASRLAERFWPGPLTLVLPRQAVVPDVVTAGGPTVAIRIPAHLVARKLLQLAGIPLAAPSANRSGELSPTTAEHVQRSLGDRVDMILDAGPTQVGLESTVLSLVESPPRLLRPGHITPAQIEAIIGLIQRPIAAPIAGPLPSPGLLARHYAPRTPTEVGEGSSVDRVRELVASGQRIGGVARPESSKDVVSADATPFEDSGRATRRTMPIDPHEYGAQLYAVLHDLDQMGLDRIVVEMPPATDEWLAVRDRLRRAAHD